MILTCVIELPLICLSQTGEYATDEDENVGPGRTEKDVNIEVFDLPENEDLISPSELDATKLYQKFREVGNKLEVLLNRWREQRG